MFLRLTKVLRTNTALKTTTLFVFVSISEQAVADEEGNRKILC